MEGSKAAEKNERGVDKALCAKRKLCESETPSVQLVFPLHHLFCVCLFVPVLKVVHKMRSITQILYTEMISEEFHVFHNSTSKKRLKKKNQR